LSNNDGLITDFSIGAKDALACIFSLSGEVLTDQERALFQTANPFGFILFKRNCKEPHQIKALVDDLKKSVGRDCPILIDQEGGRVQRLGPPHWRRFPPMQEFGEAYNIDQNNGLEQLRFEILRLAEELVEIGVNVNCAPVLDVFFDDAHDIIGDRAFGSDPEVIARLGLSVCRHFLHSGVVPIMKHIPGHGRAHADSHFDLPRVNASYEDLLNTDFAPFRMLSASDVGANIWAMTAHIIFESIDTNHPVSVSKHAIDKVIRGDIGFDGILISDDLDMKALDAYGSASDKALASLEAGCDLALYCSGEFNKMQDLAENLPKLSAETLKRLQKAGGYGKDAA
tara:strand:+ start:511 stop:1533 length:1023 start_codon:yes stop_codon:yes gene_type:complete